MAKRQLINDVVNDENSFIIDKCDACGFISYNPINRCPQCGNMILTGEKVDKATWLKGAIKGELAAR